MDLLEPLMSEKTKEGYEVMRRVKPTGAGLTIAPIDTATPAPLAPEPPTDAKPDDITLNVVKSCWTFKQVETYLDNQYNSDNSNKSVICDILAMHLKNQKLLYIEAKATCEKRMNGLMLPAILVTSLCSILGLVLKEYSYGATVVSSLNGVNAFLLALISYLKLDAKAEAHRTSAYKFEKLQSQLEFKSGKSMFTNVKDEELIKIIEQTEAQMLEIKETNNFIVPDVVLRKFRRQYNMNVFAEVKKIQNAEMQKANELRDVLNKIRELEGVGDAEGGGLEELRRKEQQLVNEIIAMKDDYLEIDKDIRKDNSSNNAPSPS